MKTQASINVSYNFFDDPTKIKWGVWSNQDKNWFELLQNRWNLSSKNTKNIVTDPHIPKIIHQIWLGKREIPESCKNFMQSWLDYNNDFDYQLWIDEDINLFDFQNKSLIEKCRNVAQKSDIMRLEILNLEGGLYLDIDFECLKSFQPLLQSCQFFAGLANTGHFEIGNSVFGCIPNHPIMNFLIKNIGCPWHNWDKTSYDPNHISYNILMSNISKYLENAPKFDFLSNIFESTGPGYFTRSIMYWLSNIQSKIDIEKIDFHNSLLIYPTRYFYPLPNYSRNSSDTLKRSFIDKLDSYAIHHWYKTWK